MLVTGKSYYRIESNEEYYVPMNLLYKNSNSLILIGVDEYDMSICISFDVFFSS